MINLPIREKYIEYQSMRMDQPEFKTWLDQSNLWNWIYTEFKIKGCNITKNRVADILEGQIIGDVPITYYAFAQSCQLMYRDMKNYLQMQSDTDIKMIERWSRILLGDDAVIYRRNNPVLYEWECIPQVHFNEVRSKLAALLKIYAANRGFADPVEKMARLYLDICFMSPFGENTSLIAGSVLLYNMLQLGLPVPEFSVNESEYNMMIADFCARHKPDTFVDMFKRSTYNRLEVVVNICKQIRENE